MAHLKGYLKEVANLPIKCIKCKKETKRKYWSIRFWGGFYLFTCPKCSNTEAKHSEFEKKVEVKPFHYGKSE